MTLEVRSTAWLLAHELRLAWRGLRGRPGAAWRAPLLAGLFLLATLVVGVPTGLALRPLRLPVTPAFAATANLLLLALFTLMLSQALAAATEALYARGDLDLLLSSPISPAKVLAVRCAVIAVNLFAAFAVLLTPVLAPVSLIGHPAWLAVYGVLASLALGATGVGLAIAVGLVGAVGPGRARAVGQILAAALGAAIFLASRLRGLVGSSRMDGWLHGMGRAWSGGVVLRPVASWPLRAMLGEAGPLAAAAAVGCLSFAGATTWIGRRFAVHAASASGVGLAKASTGGAGPSFAGGVFVVTVRKELRLLGRDVALLSRVLLRLFYLLPMMFVLLRELGGHSAWSPSMTVGAVTFMAGQTAGALVWITVAAEDAPELLACAPASLAIIRRAKLTAALAPLALVLAAPLVVLTGFAPIPGAAATIGCVAAALASGLIGLWLQKPARRSDFRRRRSGSLVAGAAELGVGGLIAAAAGLAALPSAWALAPAVLAGGALVGLGVLNRQPRA